LTTTAIPNVNILDTAMAKQNGYPLEFRLVNIFSDSMDGKYFPATIAHIIAIRNMTDDELKNNAAQYHATLANARNRVRPVIELVNALVKIAEDEWTRRTDFKEGRIVLSDYYPDLYIGNLPKVTVPKGRKK
jgi:hypothetical protein